MKARRLGSIAAALLLAALSAPAGSTAEQRPSDRGEAILADARLFGDTFLASQPWDARAHTATIAEPDRPLVSALERAYGPPDAVVVTEVERDSGPGAYRTLVYGSVAFGAVGEGGRSRIAWVAFVPASEPASPAGTEPERRACPPFYDGDWNGPTGIGQVSFTVVNNAVTSVRITFAASNGGCSVNGNSLVTFSTPRQISNNTFTVSVPPIPDLGFTLRLTLDSQEAASGTLNFIFLPCGINLTTAANASHRAFGLCIDPNQRAVAPGMSAAFPVDVLSLGGFSTDVELEVSATPDDGGVDVALGATSVAPGGGTMVTAETTEGTPLGNYTITVRGTSAGKSVTRTGTLRVTDPDFALVLDADELVVAVKEKGELPVRVERIAGFEGEVTVTPEDTKPIKVKLKPKSLATSGDEVTFTYKIKKKAQPGEYDVVFTGRDGVGRERSVTLRLVVE